MRAGDVGRLVALAAIWGASFLFTRIAAPAIGPIATADLRLLIGGLLLVGYARAIGFDPEWRRWKKQYVIVGLLNSGLPFLLFSYAALELPAGLLSLLNATAPMWAALLAAIFLRERLSGRGVVGLVLGIAGVALVSRPEGAGGLLSTAAALAAALLYGIAGVYMKRLATMGISARGMAVGTQLAAGVLILPFIALSPPPAVPTPLVAACVLALGVVCSGFAYVLYYRLVADVGATGALTVTYLVPIFGVLWGVIFLGEEVSAAVLAGGALILLGTFFVLRK